MQRQGVGRLAGPEGVFVFGFAVAFLRQRKGLDRYEYGTPPSLTEVAWAGADVQGLNDGNQVTVHDKTLRILRQVETVFLLGD